MKISLKERRFLIVWTCVNLFALIVNIADIHGTISEPRSPVTKTGNQEWVFESIPGFYLWTAGNHDDVFWPFQSKFIATRRNIGYPVFIGDGNTLNVLPGKITDFLGIFNGYDYLEFGIYMILGFVIIFLPKIWNPKNDI